MNTPRNKSSSNEETDQARLDGLTGLFNHAFFYRRIDFELKILARYGTPVSLMMVDIDDFKDFNDQYGHQEGDAVLSSVGAIIEAETRDADMAGRSLVWYCRQRTEGKPYCLVKG
jgi:diguanylate cyclase (GGDEF)-like protein